MPFPHSQESTAHKFQGRVPPARAQSEDSAEIQEGIIRKIHLRKVEESAEKFSPSG